jgi:S-formylglutathione hydrolase FrmB
MSEYTINLRSSLLAGPTDLSVILPGPEIGENAKEFYGSGKKYKVLWLLHAGSGDRNDWLRNTNIGRHAQERQLMLVIPNGLNSDFANHPEFADGYYFSDFFFDELMPFIYNWFPASDNAQDNFIAGISMGGAATWMYGLQHPEKFGGIAPLSSPPRDYAFLEAYRNLTAGEFRTKAMADRMAFPSGYGNPKNGMLTKEINMIAKYATVGEFLDSYECTWERFRQAAATGKLPKIYITCGTGERSYDKLLRLKEQADELGVKDIAYDFIPGDGHGFEFWDQVMPRVLDFFGIR